MNPFSIYLGFGLFTVAYILQIAAAINLTQETPYRDATLLSEAMFRGKRMLREHWPFFAITILFPFVISVIPDIADFPMLVAAGVNGSSGSSVPMLFDYSSKFVINYVLVLITLEFSLLYGLDNLPKDWKRLLVITAALDVCAYVLMGLLQRNVRSHVQELKEMSSATLVFLTIACLASLVASLIVVVAVTKLNQKD